MSVPGPPPGGELVEFEVEGEDHWTTITVKDGSILRFRSIVTAVYRVGNDPNTGVPVYVIQSTSAIRMATIPKDLIKKKETGTNSTTYR